MPGPPDTGDPRRRFILRKRLGVGGFGEVYLAEMSTASGFTKTVALKMMRADVQDPITAQRIRDEARLLGLLKHRSIVQADDLVTLQGRPAVIMEYVPGVNLNWLINEKRYSDRLPMQVTLAIIRQVADALDTAHSRPSTVTGEPLAVLHRDIKPSNIRITPAGEVKVLDFGIARSEDANREAQTKGYQLGSLPYMSPEVLAGRQAGPASDVYALGVTMFEILARRRFGAALDEGDEHDFKVERNLKALEFDTDDAVATDVRALLQQMLAYDPGVRPSAARVVKSCTALEITIGGEPMHTWAPVAVPKVDVPSQSELGGELTGETIYEQTLAEGTIEATVVDETMAIPVQRAQETETRQSAKLIQAGVLMVGLGVAGTIWWTQQDSPTPGVETTQIVETVAPENVVAGSTPAADSSADEPPDHVPDPEATPASSSVGDEPRDVPHENVVAAPVITTTARAPASTEPVTVKFGSAPFGIALEVDGVARGKTPTKLELSVGRHTIVFVDGDDRTEQVIEVGEGGQGQWTYRRAEGSIR